MEAVFASTDGLRAAMGASSLLIDFTTNSPLLVRRMQTELKAVGAAMLDAPVSGGVSGARSRRLAVQIGGEAADVARARPVLEAIADTVLHVGFIGTGNNLQAPAQLRRLLRRPGDGRMLYRRHQSRR